MTTPNQQAAMERTETVATRPNDRRVSPRCRVQFRTTFTGDGLRLEGMGTVLDLSLGGCRVEASLPVKRALLMELRIYVPDLDWPLMIDAAVVQWVKDQTFGLRFLQLRPTEQARLQQVMDRREEEEEE